PRSRVEAPRRFPREMKRFARSRPTAAGARCSAARTRVARSIWRCPALRTRSQRAARSPHGLDLPAMATATPQPIEAPPRLDRDVRRNADQGGAGGCRYADGIESWRRLVRATSAMALALARRAAAAADAAHGGYGKNPVVRSGGEGPAGRQPDRRAP